MALLAAPVSADAEEPWLRACATAGMDLHLLRASAGSRAGFEAGMEELLRVLDVAGRRWVALLSGPAESVAYGLSVIGAPPQVPASGEVSLAVGLGAVAPATAALVDGCDGASHRVVLLQCDAGSVDEVRSLAAEGSAPAALRRCHLVLLRDARQAWAAVGLRRGEGSLLWRVAVPAPASALPAPVAPSRRRPPALLERVAGRLAGHSRTTSRLGAALATLLIAAVAAGSAGWVITHRASPSGAHLAAGAAHTAPGGAPAARVAPMAATWDRTAQVILFAGAESGPGHGDPLGDTWSGALQPGAAWTPVAGATGGPSPRLDGAAASDPVAGDVLLFGGEGPGDTALGDTWSFAGTWTELNPQHAPPAGVALAATEPATGRVILVTACCALGPVPTAERMQTWRWTGADWTMLGPAPGWVTTAALVTDGWDGTVLMLASDGAGGALTFVWDGAAWSSRSGGAQPPVAAGTRPQLTYDPRSHSVLDVVAGADGAHVTWAWDGNAWTTREASGGPPVVGLVLGEPVDGHAVLYGGTDQGDELTQRWYWTGSGWAESIRPPAVADQPSASFGEAVATEPGTGGLLLFGGGETPDQTWVWSGSDWTQAFSITPSPAARLGASMAYDPLTRQALLVGGQLAGGAPARDMWVWQGSSWRRLVPGLLPPPSQGAPMAWDPVHGTALLVIPDGTGALPSAQTWTWDGTGWSRHLPAAEPPLRAASSLAYDPTTGGMLLAVPCCPASTTQRTETWLWDGATWQRLQTLHSPPLDAAIATDPVHGRVVLVAACCPGLDAGTVGPPQTWVWDGADWTRPAEASLPALQDVGAVATDAAGSVLLVGRLAGAGPHHPLDGLWRWTGVAWRRLF
ncbi:MAG TPA: kelch repeat-containing protein [Candidatus Dormibacteraeota bacterium]|nr:kelch repeat-containing protein [Candidatus Dormibacteraeota bacterium]